MGSWRRRALLVCGAGVLLWLVAAVAVDRAGRADDTGPADAIVVLGARVNPGGVASTTLRNRALHGVALWKQGLAPVVLFAGGVGAYGTSEAEVACLVAVDAGLPREACLLEAQSHSTFENAHLAAPMLRSRGATSLLLVSDAFHLPRARRFFSAEGFTVRASPCPEAQVHPLLRMAWTLREVPALVKQALLGR